MGLNQDEGQHRTYVGIVGGKFAKRVKEEEGGKKREIEVEKDGKTTKKTVWEIAYKSVSGMIDSIEIKGSDYGDQLLINMSEVDEKWTVNIGCNSREAKNFMNVLPNINLKAYVSLEPYNFEDKDTKKKRQGMVVKQEDKKVEWFYNAENGLPQVPEGIEKEEFKLVMMQQEIFLKKKTKLFIEENFKKAAPVAEHVAGAIEPNAGAYDKELGF